MALFKIRTRFQRIKDKRKEFNTLEEFVKSLSDKELQILAKEIIYKDFKRALGCECREQYFEGLNRWQKEFFIKERYFVIE